MYDPYEPRTGIDLYSEVAPRIILPKNLPYLIFGIGIARSGTTVFLNVMGSSVVSDENNNCYTIQSGYQHFKAGYRQAMHGWPQDSTGEKWKFFIPDASKVPVFNIKDPLGPYTHTESVYNPLTLLRMIGYPQDRLSLIFFFRDPLEVFTSWKRNWSEVRDTSVLRDNFITACHTLRSIHKQAIGEGYDHHVYLYESLRDHNSECVVQTMFDEINSHMYPRVGLRLEMTDHTVRDWDPEAIKRIWHPNEPDIYNRKEIRKLHEAAKSKQQLEYKKYRFEEQEQILTRDDIVKLEQENVYGVYEYFRSQYEASTGLEVLPPERIHSCERECSFLRRS